MAKKKVLIALDQAAKVTGYSIFKNEKYEKSGTFSVPPHKPIEERLALFYKELMSLYNEYSDYEVEIVFEDIQLQMGNVKTYRVLAYVQSIILLFCFYNKTPYSIATPSHWRKLLGGEFGRKREEQKEHAIELVRQKLKIDVSSDEADAICIGLARIKEKHLNKIGFES